MANRMKRQRRQSNQTSTFTTETDQSMTQQTQDYEPYKKRVPTGPIDFQMAKIRNADLSYDNQGNSRTYKLDDSSDDGGGDILYDPDSEEFRRRMKNK